MIFVLCLGIPISGIELCYPSVSVEEGESHDQLLESVTRRREINRICRPAYNSLGVECMTKKPARAAKRKGITY